MGLGAGTPAREPRERGGGWGAPCSGGRGSSGLCGGFRLPAPFSAEFRPRTPRFCRGVSAPVFVTEGAQPGDCPSSPGPPRPGGAAGSGPPTPALPPSAPGPGPERTGSARPGAGGEARGRGPLLRVARRSLASGDGRPVRPSSRAGRRSGHPPGREPRRGLPCFRAEQPPLGGPRAPPPQGPARPVPRRRRRRAAGPPPSGLGAGRRAAPMTARPRRSSPPGSRLPHDGCGP